MPPVSSMSFNLFPSILLPSLPPRSTSNLRFHSSPPFRRAVDSVCTFIRYSRLVSFPQPTYNPLKLITPSSPPFFQLLLIKLRTSAPLLAPQTLKTRPVSLPLDFMHLPPFNFHLSAPPNLPYPYYPPSTQRLHIPQHNLHKRIRIQP